MCGLDLEYCEVFDETKRKARKDHKCDCCGGSIVRGSTYLKHFSVFDGDITSEKICAACFEDREMFAKEHNHMKPTPGYTRELIREYLYERGSFKRMLLWARMLRRMDKRRLAATE